MSFIFCRALPLEVLKQKVEQQEASLFMRGIKPGDIPSIRFHRLNLADLTAIQGAVRFLMLFRSSVGWAVLFLVSIARGNDSPGISSSGGQYFEHRVEISVPPFAQDDPRWTDVKLGGSTDTLGAEGCAVTSAAMVAAFYGIKTDPQQLNEFLTRTGALDSEGLIDWNLVPSVAPDRWELAYNGVASYERIDESLLSGNPVIVLIPLRDGAVHFVVIVGKKGRDYLIRDPADSDHPYPLRYVTGRINGLCIFRLVHPLSRAELPFRNLPG